MSGQEGIAAQERCARGRARRPGPMQRFDADEGATPTRTPSAEDNQRKWVVAAAEVLEASRQSVTWRRRKSLYSLLCVVFACAFCFSFACRCSLFASGCSLFAFRFSLLLVGFVCPSRLPSPLLLLPGTAHRIPVLHRGYHDCTARRARRQINAAWPYKHDFPAAAARCK